MCIQAENTLYSIRKQNVGSCRFENKPTSCNYLAIRQLQRKCRYVGCFAKFFMRKLILCLTVLFYQKREKK